MHPGEKVSVATRREEDADWPTLSQAVGDVCWCEQIK